MKTRIISSADRFKNAFTKYGRNKNNLLKNLEKHGFTQFREKSLKDKSQVLLANKPGDNIRGYAFRLFPDLSMEQKYIDIKDALFSIPIKMLKITKIFADKSGKAIKEHSKKILYQNNTFIDKEERIWDIKKDIHIDKFERPGTWEEQGMKLTKTYEKTWDNNSYKFLQEADGTRHYIKYINGIEYKFSSK